MPRRLLRHPFGSQHSGNNANVSPGAILRGSYQSGMTPIRIAPGVNLFLRVIFFGRARAFVLALSCRPKIRRCERLSRKLVIARSDSDEAIQRRRRLDCFASLAMT
jgi:hypothetical protein